MTVRVRRIARGETALSRAIRKALHDCGYPTLRINSGGRQGRVQLAPAGTPDILVLRPYLWLEVKRPGKPLSPSQVAWHEWANQQGIPVAVVSSEGEAVKAAWGACRRASRVFAPPDPPPRYDETFARGLAWLDEQ